MGVDRWWQSSRQSSPFQDSASPQNRTILRLQQAGCSIKGRRIFNDFNLTVQAGERVHLAGANGAGKSTVLRCLGGTMPLSSGSAEIGGHPAGSAGARVMTGICIEPERGLYPNLSGRQNLTFAARLRYSRQDVTQIVENVQLELGITDFADEKVRQYSAGMRARVAIARALLGRPAVLLLDEPTRSLDEAGKELLWSALARRNSLACLITSHLATDRDRCDRTLTLAGGR